ncbi:hypothetical protein K439DRAFT_1316393, partial [Ramaria rubella]
DSEALLELIAELHLDLCTPPGIKMFFSDVHKTWSTIDLVFASEEISEQVTKCATDHGHGSDHEAIDLVINTSLTRHEPEPRFQFRETDWDEFNTALNAYLDTVPKSKHSAYMKRWWSRDLTTLLGDFKHAQRTAAKHNAPPDAWQAARTTCNKYHAAMRKQKHQHWRNWVEE